MCHHVDDAYGEYHEQLAEEEEDGLAEREPPEYLNEEEPDVEYELITDGGDE